MDVIPGFAPGIVRDNKDPEGTGRIRVELPGLLELTPYWVLPGNWPAQGLNRGAQYPPPDEGEHVGVMFQFGRYLDPLSVAFYFTGYYGIAKDGGSAGPSTAVAAETAERSRRRVVLWESNKLVAYIVDDPDNEDEKLVLQAKTSGSKIEINAADGESGKAETVTIEARTLLSLYAQGPIDIKSDTFVAIQGRRVRELKTSDI